MNHLYCNDVNYFNTWVTAQDNDCHFQCTFKSRTPGCRIQNAMLMIRSLIGSRSESIAVMPQLASLNVSKGSRQHIHHLSLITFSTLLNSALFDLRRLQTIYHLALKNSAHHHESTRYGLSMLLPSLSATLQFTGLSWTHRLSAACYRAG
jgi:hypothetical protein